MMMLEGDLFIFLPCFFFWEGRVGAMMALLVRLDCVRCMRVVYVCVCVQMVFTNHFHRTGLY